MARINGPSRQISVRFPAELADRIEAVAELSGRSAPQVVIICVNEFLPVLEAGVYGTPLWQPMRQAWEQDLAAAIEQLGAAAAQFREKRQRHRRRRS